MQEVGKGLTLHKAAPAKLHPRGGVRFLSPSAAESVPVPLLHIQPFPSSQGCCYCSSPLQPLLLYV